LHAVLRFPTLPVARPKQFRPKRLHASGGFFK
jgi:hypothetical protein